MKHVKKTYPVLVLLAVAALVLAACGGAPPAPPAPTAGPEQGTPAAGPEQGTPAAQVAQPSQPQETPTVQPQTPPDSVLQLSGRVWQWTKTAYNDGKTITVPNPANYTIEFFLADGKVAVKADCNNVAGSFKADATNLTITLGPSTMAACPPGSLDSEYITELGQVAQYLVEGDSLVLNFKLDSGGMTFTAGAAQPAQPTQPAQPVQPAQPAQPAQPSAIPGQDLGGKQWQWVKTALNNGQAFNPSNPADYTIEFSMVDGRVIIKADCNNATGEFMTDGQGLQIMIGGVTRAMCPPGSLSDEFLKELSEVVSYQVQGASLTLTMGDGAMTLTAGQAAAPAPSQPVAAASLEGPTWKWTGTAYSNGTTVASPDPAKYTLKFDPATQRFVFVADCNNGSGAYTVNGQNLTMHVEGMTRAFCPPPSDDYIKQLDQVASHKIDGNTLSLMLSAGSGTMTFTTGEMQPVPPASSSAPAPTAPAGSNLQRLTSGVWKWAQSVDSSGQTWNSPNPANYTIQFNPDGTANLKVDCNSAGAAYKADESNLTITPGPMTMMACPPPTLDTEFLRQLGLVSSYFFDGNDLILLWKLDSGSMKFTQ